jgi:serine/threonine-protein kinase
VDGRYRIEERIGGGGMGDVYRARQLNVERDVAVKVIRDDQGEDASALERFENEAKIISRLRHPNTLRLFDFGRIEGGGLYLVTELLAGELLSDVIERGPMEEARVLRIMAEIAGSLSEAHAMGVVHRDLKPNNVFLEKVGEREVVKVLDFGIAKAAVSGVKTTTGGVIGTPTYMSPEQARAEPLDGRSDLYSLGVLAYECLTGRPPFEGESAISVLLKHANEAPIAPTRLAGLRSAPSVGLERLVLDLLAKDPRARPESAREVERAIERIVSEPKSRSAGIATRRIEPTAHRPEPQRPQRSSATRSSTTKVLGASFGVTALVAGVLAIRWNATSTPTSPEPRRTPVTDLPTPKSSSEAAIRAYHDGLAAVRDGAWLAAQSAFRRAAKLDPDMAEAYLRAAFTGESTDEGRDAFATALRLREKLDEHDRMVLFALERRFMPESPDLPGLVERLKEARRRFPLDAEILDLLTTYQGGLGDGSACASARALVEIDPRAVDGWQLIGECAWSRADTQGALDALNRCVETSPGAADCRMDRMSIYAAEGRCHEAEQEARQGGVDSYGVALSELHASTLWTLGQDAEAVREAGREARARAPESGQATRDAYVAIAFGDFESARELGLKAEDLASASTEYRLHHGAAVVRIVAAMESGREQEAIEIAETFLKKRAAWYRKSPDFFDAAAWMERVAHHGRAEGPRPVASSETPRGMLATKVWTENFAMAAMTTVEARRALAERPPGPARGPVRLSRRLAVYAAEVEGLGGELEAAIPHLEQSVARCDLLDLSWERMRSAMILGSLREKGGDRKLACKAYDIVLRAWGAARPRSITAEAARARAKALHCDGAERAP